MAIILPAHCKGVTAGALKQIKQQGFTTAGNSSCAFSKSYLDGLIANQKGYTRHSEPLGIYMSQLNEAQKTIELTTDAVAASARKMVEEAKAASDKLTDSSRKMRDATDKLNAQMQKFHSIFSGAKFDEQAKSAQSLADALERLAVLEEKGLLSKIMQSMGKP